MSTTEVEVPKTGLTNEPLVVAGFVTWLLSTLGTIIIGHTDLITSSQWGTLSTTLVPIISAFVLGGLTWLTRKFVTPAWKTVSKAATELGFTESEVRLFAEEAAQKQIADLREKFPQFDKVVSGVEAELPAVPSADANVPTEALPPVEAPPQPEPVDPPTAG